MKRTRGGNANERLLRRYRSAIENKDYYEALQLCRTVAGRMADRSESQKLLLQAATEFSHIPEQETAVVDLVNDFCSMKNDEGISDAELETLLATAKALVKPEPRATMIAALISAFDKPFKTLSLQEMDALNPEERAKYDFKCKVFHELADVMCEAQHQMQHFDLAVHFGLRAVDAKHATLADPRVARVTEIIFSWAQAGDFALEWDLHIARTMLALMRSKKVSESSALDGCLFTSLARLFRDQVNSDVDDYLSDSSMHDGGAGSDVEKKRAMRFEDSPLIHFVQGSLLLLKAREDALHANNAADAEAASKGYHDLMKKYEACLKKPDPELFEIAKIVGETHFPVQSAAGQRGGQMNFGDMFSSLLQGLMGGGAPPPSSSAGQSNAQQ